MRDRIARWATAVSLSIELERHAEAKAVVERHSVWLGAAPNPHASLHFNFGGRPLVDYSDL